MDYKYTHIQNLTILYLRCDRDLEKSVDKSEKDDIIGLGAKSNTGVEPHAAPVFVKHIDVTDKAQIDDTIREFEQKAVSNNIETACVITSEGDVYHCTGVKDAVYPDYDLGDKIRGSIISHNHPASETEYSFSDDDVSFFENYHLKTLRGFDMRYKYELSHDHKYVEQEPDDWYLFENVQHTKIINIARDRGYGYVRWKT